MDKVDDHGEITVYCDNCDTFIPFEFTALASCVRSVVFCDIVCMTEYQRKNPEFTPMKQYIEEHQNKLKNAVTRR